MAATAASQRSIETEERWVRRSPIPPNPFIRKAGDSGRPPAVSGGGDKGK